MGEKNLHIQGGQVWKVSSCITGRLLHHHCLLLSVHTERLKGHVHVQVVLPLLQNEVVATGWVSEQDFLTGFALVQAMPGPLFNFAAYLGTPSATCCFRIGFITLFPAIPSYQRWAAAMK
jgi:hypothetical protein